MAIAETIVSSALVRIVLLALELSLPLGGSLSVDVVRDGGYEMAVEIRQRGETYAVYAVRPGTPGEDAGDLLFVAEPSDDYAQVYTVFSDASQAETAEGSGSGAVAESSGSGSGQASGSGGSAAGTSAAAGSAASASTGSGRQDFPAAVDLTALLNSVRRPDEASTAGGSADNGGTAGNGRAVTIIRRGEVTLVEDQASGMLLVVHGRI